MKNLRLQILIPLAKFNLDTEIIFNITCSHSIAEDSQKNCFATLLVFILKGR